MLCFKVYFLSFSINKAKSLLNLSVTSSFLIEVVIYCPNGLLWREQICGCLYWWISQISFEFKTINTSGIFILGFISEIYESKTRRTPETYAWNKFSIETWYSSVDMIGSCLFNFLSCKNTWKLSLIESVSKN